MKDVMKSEMPAAHLKNTGALQVSAGSGRGPGSAFARANLRQFNALARGSRR
jgi:hypothetical protein